MTTPARFCFIGHSNHGKSTLCGDIVLKTSAKISSHDLRKLEQEVGKDRVKASLLDEHNEERKSGNTHEFNVKELSFRGKDYALIDTPGHKIFVRELIKGLNHFPNIIACLLVSARKGEFESAWKEGHSEGLAKRPSGQTKEDIILARSSGIKKLVILVNKIDTLEKGDELARFEYIKKELTPFLKKCQFESFEFLAISALKGWGITDVETLPKSLGMKECLFDVIDRLSQTIPVEKSLEEIKEVTELWINVKLLQLPNPLVTSGFECVLHYRDQERVCCFETIQNESKKPYLKTGDTAKILVIFKGENRLKISDCKNVILRYGEITLGFGVIVNE